MWIPSRNAAGHPLFSKPNGGYQITVALAVVKAWHPACSRCWGPQHGPFRGPTRDPKLHGSNSEGEWCNRTLGFLQCPPPTWHLKALLGIVSPPRRFSRGSKKKVSQKQNHLDCPSVLEYGCSLQQPSGILFGKEAFDSCSLLRLAICLTRPMLGSCSRQQ